MSEDSLEDKLLRSSEVDIAQNLIGYTHAETQAVNSQRLSFCLANIVIWGTKVIFVFCVIILGLMFYYFCNNQHQLLVVIPHVYCEIKELIINSGNLIMTALASFVFGKQTNFK
jgi:hypothetical protein